MVDGDSARARSFAGEGGPKIRVEGDSDRAGATDLRLDCGVTPDCPAAEEFGAG